MKPRIYKGSDGEEKILCSLVSGSSCEEQLKLGLCLFSKWGKKPNLFRLREKQGSAEGRAESGTFQPIVLGVLLPSARVQLIAAPRGEEREGCVCGGAVLSGSRSSISHQCYVAVSLCNGLSSSCLAVSQWSWQGRFFVGPWCMVPRHLSCTRRPLLEVVGLPLPAGGSHLPLVCVTSTGRGDDQRWLTLR